MCVCVCVCVCVYVARAASRSPPSHCAFLTRCIHFPCAVRSGNWLGAEGGKAVAQALHYLPQLLELTLSCALATAWPASDSRHGGAARTYRARACATVRVSGCIGVAALAAGPPVMWAVGEEGGCALCAFVCLCVRARTYQRCFLFFFTRLLSVYASLSIPSVVRRENKLGAEGRTAVAQALQHAPQLPQTLDFECARSRRCDPHVKHGAVEWLGPSARACSFACVAL